MPTKTTFEQDLNSIMYSVTIVESANNNINTVFIPAKDTIEACHLIEDGWEYVTGEYSDGGKIFRKPK